MYPVIVVSIVAWSNHHHHANNKQTSKAHTFDVFNGKYMSLQSFLSCECMSSNGILSGMSLLNCAIRDYMHLVLHCTNVCFNKQTQAIVECIACAPPPSPIHQEEKKNNTFSRVLQELHVHGGHISFFRASLFFFMCVLVYSPASRTIHILLIAFAIMAFSSLGLKFSFKFASACAKTHLKWTERCTTTALFSVYVFMVYSFSYSVPAHSSSLGMLFFVVLNEQFFCRNIDLWQREHHS